MCSQTCNCCTNNILDQFPEKRVELEEHLLALPLNDTIEKRRGLLIGCLHKAQELFGYIPLEVQELVGTRLRLQQADVYGVISFYSFFTDVPRGEFIISVCTGTACFVKGADKILDEFKLKLDVGDGETTEDGKFSLGSLRCVGACSLAPVVLVNDKVYAKATTDTVAEIIEEYK